MSITLLATIGRDIRISVLDPDGQWVRLLDEERSCRHIVIKAPPEPYVDIPAAPPIDRPKTHPRSPRESLRKGR